MTSLFTSGQAGSNHQPCTSWYGHSFRKFDKDRIFCPTCGASRKVATSG